MKNLLLILIVSISGICFGQIPPNAFNYSAVARDALSNPIANQTIGIQISILQTSTLGPVQYQENHFVNTDDFGLFNLIIGSGAIQSGTMNSITWSADNFYLKVGMDVNGGTSFLTMGTTQLLSVPYAIHAATADSLIGGASLTETDPIFSTSVANGILASDTSIWNGNSYAHYVGEEFGGGVVFHIYKDGLGIEHGFIVSLIDISNSAQWGLDGVNVPNSESAWNGLSNTTAIITAGGLPGDAAGLCDNYINAGFNDWYLPSVNEMSMLWNNLYQVNTVLISIGGATEVGANNYWTSTETDALNATLFWFNSGASSSFSMKTNSMFVRAIRYF